MAKPASIAPQYPLPVVRFDLVVTSFFPLIEGRYSEVRMMMANVIPRRNYPAWLKKNEDGEDQIVVTAPVILEFTILNPGSGNFLPIGIACSARTRAKPKWLTSFPATQTIDSDGTRVLQLVDLNGVLGTHDYEFDLVIQRLRDHSYGLVDPEITNTGEPDVGGKPRGRRRKVRRR